MAGDSEITLGDINKTLETLCKGVENLTESNTKRDQKINDLIDKINFLEQSIRKRDDKISELENRVGELELATNEMKRFSLKNNVIIRGLPIIKRSYADTAAIPAPEVYLCHLIRTFVALFLVLVVSFNSGTGLVCTRV